MLLRCYLIIYLFTVPPILNNSNTVPKQQLHIIIFYYRRVKIIRNFDNKLIFYNTTLLTGINFLNVQTIKPHNFFLVQQFQRRFDICYKIKSLYLTVILQIIIFVPFPAIIFNKQIKLRTEPSGILPLRNPIQQQSIDK